MMTWGLTNEWKRFDSEWTKSSVPSITKHGEIGCKVKQNRGPNKEMIYRCPIRCVQCNLNVDNQNWNGDIYDLVISKNCDIPRQDATTKANPCWPTVFPASKYVSEEPTVSKNIPKGMKKRIIEVIMPRSTLKKKMKKWSDWWWSDWLILPVEKYSQVEELVLLAKSI